MLLLVSHFAGEKAEGERLRSLSQVTQLKAKQYASSILTHRPILPKVEGATGISSSSATPLPTNKAISAQSRKVP